MSHRIFNFLSTLAIICLLSDSPCASASSYYIAGAVELTYTEDVEANLENYLHFIDLAKEKNVDILVFPEATLNFDFNSREEQLKKAVKVPHGNEKIAPWKEEDYSELLRRISRKCKEKQIYALVNLVEKVSCEEDSRCQNTFEDYHDLYNTNVIFDRKGRIVSRYRKINLYMEHYMNVPEEPELGSFTSDFGVKFGHFICFDIVFKNPSVNTIVHENVTNILYPSMWFSHLPFYTAEQFHQGWAFGYNVNLISAGANNPSLGVAGSGIYLGNKDIPAIYMTSEVKDQLLVAKVPKNVNRNPPVQKKYRFGSSPVEMQALHVEEKWSKKNESRELIGSQVQTVCADKNLCCRFTIRETVQTVPPAKIAYKYRIVANYTSSVFSENREIGEFYCSIIACTTNNPNSCGKRFEDNRNLVSSIVFESISISAKVRHKTDDSSDVLAIPTTLLTSMLPLDVTDYDFEKSNIYSENGGLYQDFSMGSTQPVENILTYGIFGRNYADDKIVEISNEA